MICLLFNVLHIIFLLNPIKCANDVNDANAVKYQRSQSERLGGMCDVAHLLLADISAIINCGIISLICVYQSKIDKTKTNIWFAQIQFEECITLSLYQNFYFDINIWIARAFLEQLANVIPIQITCFDIFCQFIYIIFNWFAIHRIENNSLKVYFDGAIWVHLLF